jgi:hypothetical protein
VIRPRPHGPRLVDVGSAQTDRSRGGWLGILTVVRARAPARTRLTEGGKPSPSMSLTKRRTARIGPTAGEEEGPMPTA